MISDAARAETISRHCRQLKIVNKYLCCRVVVSTRLISRD